MKIGIITTLLIFAAQLGYSQITDTLGYSNFLAGTPALYESPNGGYAFGNNGYNDKAKAQTYFHDNSFVLRQVLLQFGAVVFESGDSSSVVRINIYDNYGFGVTPFAQADSIAPDSVLAFMDIPVHALLDDGSLTVADFASETIVIYDRFSVGIDLTQLSVGDTVGLMSTTDGDAIVASNAWELTSNNVWFTIDQGSFSWGLEVDLAIFPVIDENDPAGINDVRTGSFSLYPNPCTNQLFIDNLELSTVNINIYNILGENIQRLKINENSSSIDVSDLEPGLYFVTLSNNRFRRSSQFIKL